MSFTGAAAQTSDQALRGKLDRIVTANGHVAQSCGAPAARPLVLLAIGQSNAGNHGSLARSPSVVVVAEGACRLAVDPLPGSTGSGGSVWSRLPTALRRIGDARPVVMSVMGIDATFIGDWTVPASPLRARLVARLHEMESLGLMPDLVLWQQGEADARAGTSTGEYQTRLGQLAQVLQEGGSTAPILLARSTVCRSMPNPGIRDAASSRVAADERFLLGPDTDTLQGATYRMDGCHFSVSGLDEAAAMWASAIVATRHRGPSR